MQAAKGAASMAGFGAEAEQAANALSGMTNCCGSCSLGGALVGPDCFGQAADCMDSISPIAELIGRIVGCLAGPWCFPIVYCFDASDLPPGKPWDVSMEGAILKQPLVCCCSMCCLPLTQFGARYKVLDGDMSRYKCCQGYADGPYCCALCSPSLPFTWEAGSYGEADCPYVCLGLEVCCCTCLAFHASRELQRSERGLGYDPTEIRVDKCLSFFGTIAHCCCCAGCCLNIVGCCAGCCLGQDDFADSSQRLGNACINIGHGIYRGMRWIILISMSCMTSQMFHEAALPMSQKGAPPETCGQASPPPQQAMGKGFK